MNEQPIDNDSPVNIKKFITTSKYDNQINRLNIKLDQLLSTVDLCMKCIETLQSKNSQLQETINYLNKVNNELTNKTKQNSSDINSIEELLGNLFDQMANKAI